MFFNTMSQSQMDDVTERHDMYIAKLSPKKVDLIKNYTVDSIPFRKFSRYFEINQFNALNEILKKAPKGTFFTYSVNKHHFASGLPIVNSTIQYDSFISSTFYNVIESLIIPSYFVDNMKLDLSKPYEIFDRKDKLLKLVKDNNITVVCSLDLQQRKRVYETIADYMKVAANAPAAILGKTPEQIYDLTMNLVAGLFQERKEKIEAAQGLCCLYELKLTKNFLYVESVTEVPGEEETIVGPSEYLIADVSPITLTITIPDSLTNYMIRLLRRLIMSDPNHGLVNDRIFTLLDSTKRLQLPIKIVKITMFQI